MTINNKFTIKKNKKSSIRIYLKIFAKSLLANNQWLYVISRIVISKLLFFGALLLEPLSFHYSRILLIYGAIFGFKPDRLAAKISQDFYGLKRHLVIASRAFFEIGFTRGELLKPCFYYERTTFFFPDLFAPWKLLHYSYYFMQSWADLEDVNSRYETYRRQILNNVGASKYEVILGDHVTASIGHSEIFFIFKILGINGIKKIPSIALLPSKRDRMSDFYKAIVPEIITDIVEIKKNFPHQLDVDNFVQDSFTFLISKKYFNFYDGKGRAKFLSEWVATRAKPFAISNEQKDKLGQFLSKVGLTEHDWYVVLHVRETPDLQIRNADVKTYYEAIETVTSNGGWVFRIGDADMRPLLLNLKNVIDLPFLQIEKPPFLDLYLLSTARFMIGTCSGPLEIPFFFNVPRLITNWPFMSELFGTPNDLCLPVSYWNKELGRTITLDEQLSSSNYDSEPWIKAQSNIIPIFNKSEQINQAAKEMIKLTSNHSVDENFSELKEDSLANMYKNKIWFLGKVAQSFFKDNPNYLD